MVLNDRSLTNQKDGLSNSLNLTNQDFYVCRVNEKKKQNKTIASLQAVPSPSRAHFDYVLTSLPFYSLPCRLKKSWFTCNDLTWFDLPLPPCPFFPIHTYSVGKNFLASILHSYQIQDGGLTRKCTLARPKYVIHFTTRYTHCTEIGSTVIKSLS